MRRLPIALRKIHLDPVPNLNPADVARRKLRLAAILAIRVATWRNHVRQLLRHTNGAGRCRRLLKISEEYNWSQSTEAFILRHYRIIIFFQRDFVED